MLSVCHTKHDRKKMPFVASSKIFSNNYVYDLKKITKG
jgi:hypothetical protein